jgi:hypothetical protein
VLLWSDNFTNSRTSAGHNGSTRCNVTIVGTGELNVVQSAKVNCVTTDNYWKKRGSKVVVFAGRPLYNLYKAQPANWKGETVLCTSLLRCSLVQYCLRASQAYAYGLRAADVSLQTLRLTQTRLLMCRHHAAAAQRTRLPW